MFRVRLEANKSAIAGVVHTDETFFKQVMRMIFGFLGGLFRP